jgi:hypothetical protein
MTRIDAAIVAAGPAPAGLLTAQSQLADLDSSGASLFTNGLARATGGTSAGQQRLQKLPGDSGVVVVEVGGRVVTTELQARQVFRNGRWEGAGFVAVGVASYVSKPISLNQQKDKFGYFERSIGKQREITSADKAPITDLTQAKARVTAMIKHGGLSTITDQRAQQKSDYQSSFSPPVKGTTVKQWQPSVPLPKPIAQMSAQDRIRYVVQVAAPLFPASMQQSLQDLLQPKNLLLMGAFTGAQFVPVVNVLANTLATVLLGKDLIDTSGKVAQAINTALTTQQPYRLEQAGKELARAAAQITTSVGTGVAGRGVNKVVGNYQARAPMRQLESVVARYQAGQATVGELQMAVKAANSANSAKKQANGGTAVASGDSATPSTSTAQPSQNTAPANTTRKRPTTQSATPPSADLKKATTLPHTLVRMANGKIALNLDKLSATQRQEYNALRQNGFSHAEVNDMISRLVQGGAEGLASKPKYLDLSERSLAGLSILTNALEGSAQLHDVTHTLLWHKQAPYTASEAAETTGHVLANSAINNGVDLFRPFSVNSRKEIVVDQAAIPAAKDWMRATVNSGDWLHERTFLHNSIDRVGQALYRSGAGISMGGGSASYRFVVFRRMLDGMGQLPANASAAFNKNLRELFMKADANMRQTRTNDTQTTAEIGSLLAKTAYARYETIPTSARQEIVARGVASVITAQMYHPGQVNIPRTYSSTRFGQEWTGSIAPSTQPGYLRTYVNNLQAVQKALGI